MTSDAAASLWSASAGERGTPRPLDRDLRVDLAVVGGGFTGCAAALEAARQGASVALLEAQEIGHGGSGRNVGLVNAGLWVPPEALLRQMGECAGRRLLEVLGAGPQTVFDLIAREFIDCEATRAGTLHLAHSQAGLDDLRKRCTQGNQIGAPLRLLDAAETAARVGSVRYHGALLDPRAGTIQPLAYCRGLARAAGRVGAAVHEASPVARIRRDGCGWTLAVGRHAVRAARLLLATNAYHGGIDAPIRPRYSVLHFSQFATAPLSEDLLRRILPGGEGCWDTALVMSSLRRDAAGRLIIGGMGNRAGFGAAIHDNWARRKLRELFPEAADVPLIHRWQGRISMTRGRRPKVIAFGPGAYAVFGYCGRGIAPGTVFGTAAGEALLNDRPEAFPVPVEVGHAETLPAVRSAFVELGATLAHAVQPSGYWRARGPRA